MSRIAASRRWPPESVPKTFANWCVNNCYNHLGLRGFTLWMWGAVAGVLGLGGSVAVGAQSGASSTDVTFTKDIAPILQRHCQSCHRPDSLAPMSLLTYEDARPYARAIKTRTALRTQRGTMPPWFIEKDIGIQQYKDDPSLSEEEITKIATWVDGGAPRGNP